MPFSAQTRSANLTRMAEERFDVLVIGGGITGVGIALDAAPGVSGRDVVASWAGLRALLGAGQDDARTYDLSRKHVIFEDPPGREMAITDEDVFVRRTRLTTRDASVRLPARRGGAIKGRRRAS